MKNKILVGLISLSLAAMYSCSDLHTVNYGYIYTSVVFPQKSFNIKKIPLATSVVTVEVTGEGLLQPISFTLTKDDTKKLLNNVPIGSKLVKATARDIKGIILAKGESRVSVIANTKNTIEIELAETAVSTSVSTGNSNSSGGNSSQPVNSDQPGSSDQGGGASGDNNTQVNNTPGNTPVDNTPDTSAPSIAPSISPDEKTDPTATNTDSGSSSGGGGGSSFFGGDNSHTGPSAVVNITTSDGSPVPPGIVVQTVGPTPTASATPLPSPTPSASTTPAPTPTP